ncbi:MAG TPA: winged helix DNA-binding domain-containing protein [Nocardioidaceae bacterium]|nr:winged helix DNA-binding domain-containing protein [Nocardioidaceae bacterium]
MSRPRLVTVAERRARLARRHLLLPGTRTDDVAAIAEQMVALHSSDPVTVYLSATARMKNPAIDAVEKALYVDRSVVRHHAMRRTLWVATPDAARAMHAAATRKLVAPERRRTLKLLADSGVADPAAWLADAERQVLAAFHEHGPMTTRAVGARVPALRQPLVMSPGKTYSATVSAHTRVLLGLGFAGALVRTRPTGSWVNGQYTWTAADDWLPGGLESSRDPADAARELADRWLRGFGPGTTEDLQWWAGWTAATTRRALADAGAVAVRLPEGEGWFAAGDEEPADNDTRDEPWVTLLPSLDPTTMGWKQREWYLPAECADAFDANGNAGPTIWVDGRVVGAWAQAPDGTIRTHYFLDVPAPRRCEVDAQADRLRETLGETRFTVRFPGRIQRVLLG